ncbi:MAG: class I SAM-dependent methyltransferase [Actinomycetes bacterium]
MGSTLTDTLRHNPPGIHGDGDEFWGLDWGALGWIERAVRAEMSTLEIGAGASTIVFAASGATHSVVTPDPREEERIRAACERLGISSANVTFHIGPSHEVLPRLEQTPLDLVLVDGAHGFPYPILDWWAVAPRVRIGGTVLLDDAYMPPVLVLVDALAHDTNWQVAEAIGFRTAVVTKLGDGLPPFDWDGSRMGGRMSFRYLHGSQRATGAVRQRLFNTRAGLRIVGLVRRRSELRWRKTG